jgi:hypothetical protein
MEAFAGPDFAYSVTRTYRIFQYISPGEMVTGYAKTKPEDDVTAGITPWRGGGVLE